MKRSRVVAPEPNFGWQVLLRLKQVTSVKESKQELKTIFGWMNRIRFGLHEFSSICPCNKCRPATSRPTFLRSFVERRANQSPNWSPTEDTEAATEDDQIDYFVSDISAWSNRLEHTELGPAAFRPDVRRSVQRTLSKETKSNIQLIWLIWIDEQKQI